MYYLNDCTFKYYTIHKTKILPSSKVAEGTIAPLPTDNYATVY